MTTKGSIPPPGGEDEAVIPDVSRIEEGTSRQTWGRRIMSIRILLADDHTIVLQGLSRCLQEQEGLEVMGQA